MIYTKDKDIRIQFRINQYDYEILKKLADQANISVSLYIRNLILIYLHKEKENNANL